MLKRLVAISIAVVATLSCVAQQFAWSADYSALFCNREGGDEQTPDQTFLLMRLSPEVGVRINHGGQHTLKGGVAWTQPMIASAEGGKVVPTLYYNYKGDAWRVTMGMFPRTMLKGEYPRYVWSDSLNYFTPNVRGIAVQYVKPHAHAQLMLDWRQMQSTVRREAFVVIADGAWHSSGMLTLGGLVQYNHLAKRKNAPDSEGVNDDAIMSATIGLDLTRKTSLDSMLLSAGPVLSLQRARADGKWQSPAGAVVNAHLRYRWLEANQNFFFGKDLFPLYERFGSELNLGDPYYRYKFYSRTSLAAHVINNHFVDLNVALIANATNRCFGFWQQVSLRFLINDSNLKAIKQGKSHSLSKLHTIF